MKKLFILSLAALLALAFGSAYAQATPAAPVLDFKASGYFTTDFTGVEIIPQAILSPASRNNQYPIKHSVAG